MNMEETTDVLTMIALYCKMSPPGKSDVVAWNALPLIREMDYGDAKRAVIAYYQQHKSPMAAVDLIQTVKVLPRQDKGFHGEPGESICSRCRGVHYPHEDCSVLVPMPANFREMVKSMSGVDPADLFKVPEDVELLEGF